ncbi:E3 ubiquitin-protein ligase hel2-like [Phragmites australis]|uniref:E3 ubiquitin-protein ligase hel2-like n=1 Tax=Phragmites australis TaxID=29695 RepID=UPI002D77595B|nr:E3 ubiquitin-protein ligase hel2-like [Phragmites australis]
MDDSCAVCADALEWVAYGPCGHREVCSTCVVRLRFVMDDKRCCICKTHCASVFVTKAMGDYTRVVADFSVFPTAVNEGKVVDYWYHEDTQAYFDDADHYRMIRAMCRLSCSVCDNAEDQVTLAAQAKRRSKFRSIEQLKGHLFHVHRLYMCSLCLEGRKVFICEQKLYTRSQLTQHMKTGDSEVDGSEVERSGFAGHPMCEFCKSSFYGDNELYTHMSREHYSCHICQRQHPGQYDYFRNYDDLELHFRKDHFLCEDEACLAKKFVVFQSEAELKRHNAMEHGGRMSRAQRNAALQIPTSFIYRRNEQDQRRGRGRGRNAYQDGSDGHISSAQNGRAINDDGPAGRVDNVTGSLQSLSVGSSSGRADIGQSSRTGRVLEQLSFPPLSDPDIPDARVDSVPDETSFPSLSEQQSRYALALNQSSRGAARLGDESLFPPLPGSSSNRGAASARQGLQSLAKSTLAARLQRSKGPVKVLHTARSRPSENPELLPSVSSSTQTWPTPDQGLLLPSSSQPRIGARPTRENGFISSNSAWNPGGPSKMKHSVSTPNLVSGGSSGQALSSTAYGGNKNQEPPQSSQTPLVEDVRAANKSLVEKMRAALGMDEDRYSAFKEIAGEYRQGVIDTLEYLSYVEQFGLSHLVPEMARLLPDPRKQRELADAYYTNIRFKSLQENGGGGTSSKEGNRKKKGKGKAPDVTESSAAKDVKDSLADSFLDSVRKLQSNHHAQGEAEVLSRDGYRPAKGIQLSAGGSSSADVSLDRDTGSISKASGAKDNPGKGGGNSSSNNSKQSKKTSKFLRARLGDNSLATLDLSHPSVSPEQSERESQGPQVPQMGLPVRGVWKNGGGQKLFSSNGRK